ncbi:PAS domain S-box protein [Roseateles sp. DB2]|uniref:PAS domain S-box protein n=1 Tax=Roseateles sp. DB2 TaxID=3453717 RepID=UPI003EEAD05D
MHELSDPVLLLGRQLDILEANPAAQALDLQAGGSLQSLRTAAGTKVWDWLKLATQALAEGKRAPAAPTWALSNGQRAQLKLIGLSPAPQDSAYWMLHARVDTPVDAPRPVRPAHSVLGRRTAGEPAAATGVAPLATQGSAAHAGPAAAQDLMQVFWHAAIPAFVEDGQHRLQAANEALLALLGRPQEALLGQDFAQWLAPEDRAQWRERPHSRALARSLVRADAAARPLRLREPGGQERWIRLSSHRLPAPQSPSMTLVLLQDCSSEMQAREQVDRMHLETAQWLDLSPLPMVLFDAQGLLLRHNSAFAALCLQLPATLHEAEPALQSLLGWTPQGLHPALLDGHGTLLTQASLPDPQGRTRWWQAKARALPEQGTGQRRVMALLEDRSLEQERDLAHQQLDALMDTAGVGLATFQQDAGWLRPRAGKTGTAPAGPLAGLQGVGRDIVEPESLPEFERLQRALKTGEKAEVRYAVRHPELGRRWLLTRVEPGQLGSGQRTTSVVTLDMTAQQQAQARSEQLLHELTTTMDGAGLGLAYLRGQRLVRCNPGFARMLGHATQPEAGTGIARLFEALPALARQVQDALQALDPQQPFEAEFQQVGPAQGQARWLSLSLKAVPAGQSVEPEAIAVISDISRLKSQQAQLETLVQDRELMFSLSDVGIAILRNGRIERANEALAQLTGYRIEELVGLPMQALYESQHEYEHIGRLTQMALQDSGLWRGERRVRRRDGSLLWMQVSKRLMRQGLADEALIATYVNVDDRWRAQQSLLLQAERERAVLDSVLVGIVTVGRGGIEWMNRSARRMFGGDLVEFLGQPMSIVATPEPEHPFRQTHYLDELTEGQAETFECRLMARDGREFWVVGNAVVTGLAEHGRQLTYALLDIERRRQAEAQTQQAQASLRRIIEAAPLAISLLDARSLRLEKINQVAARLAGRPEQALLGATPEELFGPEQGGAIRQDMEAALQTDAVTQREYPLRMGGETRIWDTRYLHLSDVSRPDGASEPEQLLMVASDVTEQRAAEAARLEAAIAQRELLVKEVHHRIKNNLQGVAGLLQQIAARRPEIKGVISEAVGQVQAIAQVYGLQVGGAGPLRVPKVVEAITGSVQRMFGRPIHCHIEGSMAAEADRWALPEAESIPIALTLNELLTNAIKHSVDAPIHCHLRCDADRVSIQILNPGQLPPGFSLAGVPGSVSGLGLVRALLPRRSAKLSLEQQGLLVCCTMELQPPGITWLAAS